MAVPPAHDVGAGATDQTDHDTTSTAGRRPVLLAVLVLVLVASLGVNAWLVSERGLGAVGVERGAGEIQTEREAVMSQSRQFMLRMGTYGPDQLEGGRLPEYRRLVTEVITPKFATSFEQSVTAAEQIVSQSGTARRSEVLATGVSLLDDDEATALVAGAFTTSYPDGDGELQEQEPVPFRMVVTLNRIDGEWLVDDFDPATGADQGVPQ